MSDNPFIHPQRTFSTEQSTLVALPNQPETPRAALLNELADDGYRWTYPEQRLNRPPRHWMPWLLDEGSLTAKLTQASHGQFAVEVVEETWTLANRNYREVFGLHRTQRMWSRKVILKGQGRPWVTAHSVIPVSSLNSPLKQLKYLNTRPLGALLFSTPGMQRGPVQICKTPLGWGRRSLFFLYNKPLMVAEYFLPDLVDRVNLPLNAR